MSTEQLISQLRMLDIEVSVEGDRLRCSAPPGRLTKELEKSLVEHKAELISTLRFEGGSSRIARRTGEKKPLPLSFAQERFWFEQNLNPDSRAYNITASCRLQSRVDYSILEQALRALVLRHEVLRTRFVEVGGVPAQEVLETPQVLSLELHDLRGLNEDECKNEVSSTIREFGARPFDLSSGQLLRAALVRLSEADSYLVVTAHHIVCDGWSLGVLFRELRKLYQTLLNGQVDRSADLPIQYADYAIWERERLSSSAVDPQVQYWKEKLKGAPASIDFPLDHPRKGSPIYESRLCPFQLDVATSESLKKLAKESAATPFMVLLAVFTTLLSRYSGKDDIVVGTPVSTRTNSQLEQLIGCFINTHLLRTVVSREITARELLKQVRSTVIESLTHGGVPFEVLVRELLTKRDLSLSPLFQQAFILLNTPQAQDFEVVSGGTALDMTLYMWEAEGSFKGSLEYDGALFDPETISCFTGCFRTLAREMAAQPDSPLGNLALMTAEQENEWFFRQKGLELDLPFERADEWMKAQVQATPDKIAIISGGDQLTFQDLWSRSKGVAQRLEGLGVKPGDIVALCVDRTADMAIAPLAVWLAGAAYLPLDPAYPKSRLAFMLEDAGASALITETRLLERLPGKLPPTICLDGQQSGLAKKAASPSTRVGKGDDLAYLMYTSGSTGTPKGVEICHRSLVNLLASMQREPGIGPADRLLAVTTLSFDISGLELFLPLVSGAQLIIAPSEAVTDGTHLARLLTDFDITVMQATPATWRLLLESGWKGKPGLKILCGGEALPRQLAEQLLAKGAELWNLYGPTETTIWSTVQRIRERVERIPIGFPIANTQLYVVDENGKPSLPGLTGELLIGGLGLARGYRKRADLTSEKFVEGIGDRPRLYRTGDLVRRLPDGTLEFVNRMDQQVKVRGFRIELEEIQAALDAHRDVAQSVVIVRESSPGEKKLVAYWKARHGATATSSELRRALRSILPEVMIPAELVKIETFPLTLNGKVDRRALIAADAKQAQDAAKYNRDRTEDEKHTEQTSANLLAPSNYVEVVLESIWCKVLQVEKVGVDEDFFELGGHSLLATRVIAAIRAELEMDLPLRSIFANPTIAGLARHISFDPSTRKYTYALDPPQWKRLVPVQPRGDRTPLFFLAGYHKPDGPLLFLSHLIPHLGKDQPVFGFQPRWMEGQGDDYASVEEIARDYLKELRTVQPAGPYLLGANCVEGTAVLEIARLLEQDGEEVKAVVLLDTERPSTRRILRKDFYFYQSKIRHKGQVLMEIVRAKDGSRFRLISELVARKVGKSTSPETRENDRFSQQRVNYWRLLYRHKPKSWGGRLTVIGNEQELSQDPDFGWTGFSANGVELRAVPGTHETMLTEHGREVARIMRQCIDDALAKHVDSSELAEMGIR